MVLGSSPVAVIQPSDFTPASSKEFLDIQATIECRFTLKRVRDITRRYTQMRCRDKYSEHTSVIGQFGQLVECSFKRSVVLGSSPVAVT